MLGQVRIVGEDGSVKRVSKDTLIPVGSRILVPRRLLADLTATPVSSGPSPAAGTSFQLHLSIACSYGNYIG